MSKTKCLLCADGEWKDYPFEGLANHFITAHGINPHDMDGCLFFAERVDDCTLDWHFGLVSFRVRYDDKMLIGSERDE